MSAGSTIVRLREPRHIDDTDTSSPIVVGHMVVGDTGSGLFVGSVVTVAHLVGHWRSSPDTGQHDDRHPTGSYGTIHTRHRSGMAKQLAQKLKVYAPHTMILPQTWSEPPV